MLFQIKEIILWPRDTKHAPRRVPFFAGKVNVISGASRTGKSAVIPIIDYCLASRSCSIPVNTIRKACQWFGIVIITNEGEKLLARREPGSQRSTDDMYLLEGPTIIDMPASIPGKNINSDDVRRMLDELSGLTKLDFVSESQPSGFNRRPSFRDLAAFNFQPQNIIANPDVMFFKTNTFDHREKLKRIFPYILDAVTPAMMAKQYEHERVQSELRKREKELKNIEDVSAQWNAELRSKVSEAMELGLLPTSSEIVSQREVMISLLEEIVNRADLTIAVSTSTISDAVKELNKLETEEIQVSHELTSYRRRLAEMIRARDSSSAYSDALRVQRERLQISDWLFHQHSGEVNCPMCGSDMDSAGESLIQLQSSLRELEETAGDAADVPAAFDRELQRVQTDAETTADKLKAVQLRKRALSQRSDEANKLQFQAKKAERFVGNLENALRLQRRLGDDNGLRAEVLDLRLRERQLYGELRAFNIEERKSRALRIVNSNAQKLLPSLDAERPNDPVSLEIKDLTIKVTGLDREDYLSEIGSGSNWLSYHIAVLLGLHQFFLSLAHSPIPGFLVIDQPSQVYFPKKAAVREGDEQDDVPLKDEDVEAVQKVFALLGQVVGSAKGKLQIIVLDHAPRSVWGGISNVEELEEWRDGNKLVPIEWL